MARFTVVLRGPSGAYWPPGKHFTVASFPAASGSVSISLQTRRAVTPNFSRPTPRGIHVEITGEAHSLDESLTAFSAAAELISPIVSVVSNAPIGMLDVELAFESTPGSRERLFFQQFLLDERVLPIDLHAVPNASLKAVLQRLPKHPENERLHRAMSYYHNAISQWRPGAEIVVLAYLYMAAEALTPIVRAAFLEKAGGRDALLALWGVDVKQLDSEARCRGVFEGNVAVYKKAKHASDGFEHAFASFTDIRADASQVLLPTAGYVRRTILRQLSLPDNALQQMLADPYDRPFYLHYTKFLRGRLVSNGDALSAPDQLYPILTWRSTRKEAPSSEPEADPRVTYDDQVHLRAAEGVQLLDATVHIVGQKGTAQAVAVAPRPTPTQTPPNHYSPIWHRRSRKLVAAFIGGALLLLLVEWLASLRR